MASLGAALLDTLCSTFMIQSNWRAFLCDQVPLWRVLEQAHILAVCCRFLKEVLCMLVISNKGTFEPLFERVCMIKY
jgi:hypothetical protein